MPNQKQSNNASGVGEREKDGQQLPAHLLYAAARGWRLLPVKERGKDAFMKGWPEKATSDIGKITEWFHQHSRCNWGLATGKESGVFVIDADGDDAIAELHNLGPMPPTFTVKTARGKHFYFQYPSESKLRNWNGKIARKSGREN